MKNFADKVIDQIAGGYRRSSKRIGAHRMDPVERERMLKQGLENDMRKLAQLWKKKKIAIPPKS